MQKELAGFLLATVSLSQSISFAEHREGAGVAVQVGRVLNRSDLAVAEEAAERHAAHQPAEGMLSWSALTVQAHAAAAQENSSAPLEGLDKVDLR